VTTGLRDKTDSWTRNSTRVCLTAGGAKVLYGPWLEKQHHTSSATRLVDSSEATQNRFVVSPPGKAIVVEPRGCAESGQFLSSIHCTSDARMLKSRVDHRRPGARAGSQRSSESTVRHSEQWSVVLMRRSRWVLRQ